MDRLERKLRIFLTVIALVAVPLGAWCVGHAVYSHYTLARQTRLAQLHPVTASLLTEARSRRDRPGAQSGFHALVTVWLDASGDITAPPRSRDFASTAGVAMGCASAFGAAATACGLRWALGKSLDRRRLAQWAREWERVEPGWGALHALTHGAG
ncbi:hypothetical protein ABZ646_04985 [Streptomyces sp. NPDC007162]|uniref:hypothetical protein n=1 Tax=Streptomyces sp. NPDC007162 TaxID=3156917 RepID=UPI0033DFB8B7